MKYRSTADAGHPAHPAGAAPLALRDPARETSSRDLLRQVFDLNTIFDIGCRFSAVLDTNALLDGIIFTAISQLGVGAAAVSLQGPDSGGVLSIVRGKGWAGVPEEVWMIRSDSLFARAVCERNRPVRLGDLDSQTGGSIPVVARLRDTGCELVAPFHGRECLRGMLFLSGKLNGQPFSEPDIRFLDLLIVQLSVAIDNAVLYESERKFAHDLIEARERLAQSERMATLGRLSVAIAHEINNPLGIIRNYLQIAGREIPENASVHQALETVAAEVERIARIVRQLLDAFRPESVRPSAVDLGEIVREVAEFVEPVMRQTGITVRTDGLESLAYVAGRQDSLKQVFINILLNARDAMPRGGVVTVLARQEPRTVTVEIQDEGAGLDERDRDHVFDAFYSTKESGRGTGLGLFISRNIVEGFGGTIDAANVEPPGRGAVFRITLPRVDVSQEATSRSFKTGNRNRA